MGVEAVVLAAGLARRLGPLSERFPKAVLPIDGRPAIATLLGQLAAGGVRRVTLVVGEQRGPIVALLGDGGAFEIELRYVEQVPARGSADALRLALEAGARPPLVVCAADTLFASDDPGRLVRLLEERSPAGAMSVRRRPPPGPGRPAVAVEEGRVLRVRHDAPGELSGAPLWGVGQRLTQYLEELPGPPFEIATLMQRAVDAGEKVAALEIGRTRDLTYPIDLLLENFPYLRALEESEGSGRASRP
ncbi:MAG: nucleotidyltransferase family protein [Gaiellaceae bacterium]